MYVAFDYLVFLLLLAPQSPQSPDPSCNPSFPNILPASLCVPTVLPHRLPQKPDNNSCRWLATLPSCPPGPIARLPSSPCNLAIAISLFTASTTHVTIAYDRGIREENSNVPLLRCRRWSRPFSQEVRDGSRRARMRFRDGPRRPVWRARLRRIVCGCRWSLRVQRLLGSETPSDRSRGRARRITRFPF